MCGAKAITTIALLGSFVQGNAAVAAAEMESHGQTHPQRECDSPVGTWLYTVTIPDPSAGNPTPTSSPGTVSEVDAHVVLAIAYLFLGRIRRARTCWPSTSTPMRDSGRSLYGDTRYAELLHRIRLPPPRYNAALHLN